MFFTFSYSLAGGMLAVLATGRVEQIATRFLRVIAILAFAMFSLVLIWAWGVGGSGGGGSGAGAGEEGFSFGSGIGVAHLLGTLSALLAIVLILAAPFAHRIRRAFRGICAVAGVSGMAAGAMASLALLNPDDSSATVKTLLAVSQLAGSWMLGSITVAWLLGHAYLTATRMTIAPLQHFSRMLSLAVAIRWGFLLISLMIAAYSWSGQGATLTGAIHNSWLVVSLRVGVGLGAVAVFAYMVSDCVRLRATQSATGILYFGSLFAYVGELASQHLVTEIGWPL